jgi:flavodoxin
MHTIILYASKSGNTKKIADSIANALGCEAIKVTAESKPQGFDLESYDLVLVGTGLFAGTPNEDIMHFLSNLNFKSQKQFALFITWGGAPHSDKIAFRKLHALLEAKGQRVLDDHFTAYGGWKGILMKRGHPKPEEIAAAAEWAKKIKGKNGKQSKRHLATCLACSLVRCYFCGLAFFFVGAL